MRRSAAPLPSSRTIHIAILALLTTLPLATPSEDGRIIGEPSLTCSSHYAIIFMHTTEPFQGRVSVLGKEAKSGCTQEYSHNLQNNATIMIDLNKCTQSLFTNNGSRIMRAYVDISFHPLVVTASDRVYHVECIDTTLTDSLLLADENNSTMIANCTHTARPASRWEPNNIYRVGDAVVHEWNCVFNRTEHGKYYTFLTSCNAISRTGEVIHLIDENGCIIDPDLMGELSYNNFTARIYSRARIFRFASGESYRIECHMQMCNKHTTCGARSAPPRCAFTKEDFQKRYDPKSSRHGVANFSPVLLSEGGPFDYNIMVSSDWMTVNNNPFTDLDALGERFYLTANVNYTISDSTPAPEKHFLAGISYRDPKDKILTQEFMTDTSDSFAFTHPDMPSTIKTEPDDMTPVAVPTFTDGVSTTTKAAPIQPFPPSLTTGEDFLPPKPTIVDSGFSLKEFKEKFGGEGSLKLPTDLVVDLIDITESPPSSTTTKTTRAATASFYRKSTAPPSVANIITSTPEELPATSTTAPSTTEEGVVNNRLVIERPTGRKPIKHVDPPNAVLPSRSDFRNHNDWRLDDGNLNDTEVFAASVHNCANATHVIRSLEGCHWSGFEHVLLVWSICSFVAWVFLLGYCIYKYNSRQPEWGARRHGGCSSPGTSMAPSGRI